MTFDVEIIISIISLIGTIITVWSGSKLTAFRIEQLEKKVEKHNSVIERTQVLEEKMKVSEHRIADLEEITHERH